jgi:HlyD family secretion protein/macrolide-specific efflux system membrane fusion protein
VSSKITARIVSVPVKENDNVTAGQVVATLDGKELGIEKDTAEYKVTNTRAKYKRIEYLHSIGAKSDEDLEDALYNFQTATSSLDEAKSNLDETVIVSPIDGFVVGQPKTIGTMAVQGTSNPTVIMRIADLSKTQINAKVDETDIGNIQIGQKATFSVDAYPGRTFTATVDKISQTDVDNTWDTDSSSTTSSTSTSSTSSSSSVIYYYVILNLDDEENLLKPSMTARVVINTAEKENTLAVPLTALKTNNSGSYVVLVKPDGSTENRTVTTGIYSDEFVEIVDGLDEGDQVSIEYKAGAATTTKKSSSQGPPPM